jgi:hypothetical protein
MIETILPVFAPIIEALAGSSYETNYGCCWRNGENHPVDKRRRIS